MNDYLIDTHFHLDLTCDVETILMDAESNNVKKFIISGCDKKSIRDGLEIINRYPNVYMTIGFHPDEVDNITDDDLLYLEKLININHKIIGIGEIGLDYYHNDLNIERQKEYFEKQLNIAKKFNMPVVIHTREATEDTYEVLKKYNLKGVLHCYSGSLEMAKLYLNMGYMFGIGGVLTFKNSKLKDVVKELPLQNLVLETDSPYLAPEPKRGSVNEPKNIKIIANCLAKVKEISLNEVTNVTTDNAKRLFDLMH